jgi:sulfur carrier protein ThiS adenylyltransferase
MLNETLTSPTLTPTPPPSQEPPIEVITAQPHAEDRRAWRYKDIVPAAALLAHPVTIIGIGSIGRQVALQLAAMGATQLTLIDFDKVEDVNLGPQGYNPDDIGKSKVDATAQACFRLNPQARITNYFERFHAFTPLTPAIFTCVDSIDARTFIWQVLAKPCADFAVPFYVDGRMAAETMRIITVSPNCYNRNRGDSEDPITSLEHYPTTLFPAAEAEPLPCTAKSTIYCANVCAGLMVAQFTKHLRGFPMDCDFQLNLLDNDISR